MATAAFDESATAAKSRTYYKATNTLVLDTQQPGNTGFQPAFTSLDQIALLTTTGDVPDDVAKKLGSGEDGSHSSPSTSSPPPTAAPTRSRSPRPIRPATKPLRLPMRSPTSSSPACSSATPERYNQQRDSLSTRINNLTGDGQPAHRAARGQPERQGRRGAAQHRAERARQHAHRLRLAHVRPAHPAPRLSALERAQAVPISQAEYDSRLNLGALGQNHLQADSGTDTADDRDASATTRRSSGPVARGVLGALCSASSPASASRCSSSGSTARIRTHARRRGRVRLARAGRGPRVHARRAARRPIDRGRRGAALACGRGVPGGALVAAVRPGASAQPRTRPRRMARQQLRARPPRALRGDGHVAGARRGQDHDDREPRRGVRRSRLLGAGR